jgi:hypothetical protein
VRARRLRAPSQDIREDRTLVRACEQASASHLIAAGVPMGLTNPLQIAGAPLWETWKIDDIQNPVAATKTEAATAGGIIYPFEFDGKTYISDAALQEGKSWLVDLSVDPPARALEAPGWAYYGVKFH